MPKAEYRSSIRSKNLIKKALAKLIQEKDISKITVSDIIREADISRGTFYSHYPDVYGVVEQIEKEELEKFIEVIESNGFESITAHIREFIQLVCDYLYRDFEYYRMVTQSHMLRDFIERLVAIYYEKIQEELIELDKTKDKSAADVFIRYVSAGVKTVLRDWLNGEIKGTPDEIAEALSQLVSLTGEFYFSSTNSTEE